MEKSYIICTMSRKPSKEDIEESWEYVKDDLIRQDGLLDWDKLKEMIHYYHFVESQASSVYMEITGGNMSKVNYYAHDVISEYERHIEDLLIESPKYIDLDFTESEDWVAWILEHENDPSATREDERLIAKYHVALFNYIESYKKMLTGVKEILEAKDLKKAKELAQKIIDKYEVE